MHTLQEVLGFKKTQNLAHPQIQKIKRNFTDCKLETLVIEVEAIKNILFGMMSSGINYKWKRSEWTSVCEMMIAAGLEQHTLAENIKVVGHQGGHEEKDCCPLPKCGPKGQGERKGFAQTV